MSKLRTHMKKDKAKWIITAIALTLVFLMSIAAFVKLDRQTTTTAIGWESYEIGILTSAGEESDENTSIRLKDDITVDGLSINLDDDAKITYKLFFYDKDGKFLSSTAELATDYDSSLIPANAETVRIMITPTADDDGKVSIFELSDYSKQLNVIVNK